MSALKISRAMILDDDQDFLVYLQQMLGTYKIQSDTFEHSDDFLAVVGREQDDLLFIDMVMPGKDGIQVLENLARQECNNAIVLVTGAEDRVLSAATQFAELVGLRIAGRLHKPFWRGELGVLLEQISEQRGGATHRQLASKAIQRALKDHRLTVLYDPIVDLDRGQVVGAEALSRLETPSGELIRPENLMPSAERADLLGELAGKVLEVVTGDQQFFLEHGLDLNIAVDVVADHLDVGLASDRLQELCEKLPVPAASLSLEIPEKLIASGNTRDILGGATRLRILGVGLTIDHFGHGQMSEERLYQLPFTRVKIDGSLVRAAAIKDRSQVRFQQALALARSTGWEISADGVDNEAALNIVRGAGCHIVQGLHLSKPMPAHALPAWLDQWQETAQIGH